MRSCGSLGRVLDTSPPLETLADRAAALGRAERAVLGLCGAPGVGKSTLSDLLVDRLGTSARTLPMDGFHLHDDELARQGLADRKGAPETFDVGGYVALLRRLKSEETVYAPSFDRSRELALAGAIVVLPRHRLVVTEGNYLLYDAPGWRDVRSCLDEVWFLDTDDDVRRSRLIARHVEHGRTRQDATAWVLRSDEANARLVAATRDRADLDVRVP